MSEKFRIYTAVWLVLVKEGNILLSRRFNTGYMDGNYTLVSGHLEENEGVTNAMIREAKEEAGIILKKESILVQHTQHRKCPDREYVDFYLTAENWSGEPINQEPDKCDDLAWFPLDNLPKNILPNVIFVLDQIKKGNYYSEFGW